MFTHDNAENAADNVSKDRFEKSRTSSRIMKRKSSRHFERMRKVGPSEEEDGKVENAGGHTRTDTVRLHEAEPRRREAVFSKLAKIPAGIIRRE